MHRYFLNLSFVGTNYHGWQIQENALTVQEILQDALSIVLKEKMQTTGCGRTDTGVHAKIFFAHFDTENFINNKNHTLYQINSILPEDISLNDLFAVSAESHARFSAASRNYEYKIHQKKNPFQINRSWYYPHLIDIERLNECSKIFIGKNNLKSFSKEGSDTKNYICNVIDIKWSRDNDEVILKITADRFLRNMVRAITGTLLNAQKKNDPNEYLNSILTKRNRSAAGYSVPSHGLYLSGVEYPFLNNVNG